MNDLPGLSLFSGCLGLDHGLEEVGFRPVAYVENDRDCQKVIAARRPDIPIIGDARDRDALAVFKDQIVWLAGGFPCQDLSYAEESGARWRPKRTLVRHGGRHSPTSTATRPRGKCARARYSRTRASLVRPGRGRLRGICNTCTSFRRWSSSWTRSNLHPCCRRRAPSAPHDTVRVSPKE